MSAGLVASFSSRVFSLALRDAIPVLLAGAVIAFAWRRIRRKPAPIAGLLLAVAAAFALSRIPGLLSPTAHRLSPLWDLPDGLAVGLALLVAGAFAARLFPARRAAETIIAVGGAFVIATRTGLPHVLWVRAVTGAAIVVGGALLAEFDRRWRDSALAVPLVAVSAVGIYVGVPETTQASVLVAAAVPLALLAWPRPMASLGVAGAFATAGVMAWTVAAGGLARPPTIVGGLACVGLLAVEPLARAFDRGRSSVLELAPQRWRLFVALGGQFAFVATARVVGSLPSVSSAALVAAMVFVAAVALAIGLVRVARQRGIWSMTEVMDEG